MFGRLGPVELLLILAVVLVIFGAKKLPDIGSSIGKAIQSFKEGVSRKEPGDVQAASRDDAPDGRKPGRS